MRQGDILWANMLAPSGWRPVVVLTRSDAISQLHAVTVAPITRTVRGLPTEVRIGAEEGLPSACVIGCDNIATVDKNVLGRKVGALSGMKMNELYDAIHAAFELPY